MEEDHLKDQVQEETEHPGPSTKVEPSGDGGETEKEAKPPQGDDKEKKKEGGGIKGLAETLRTEGQKESGSDLPRPGRIDPYDLCRVRDLFVPSADYSNRLAPGSNRPDYNVWIVLGPEHAGKLTTAMNLAIELLCCKAEDAKVYCYRRTLTDNSTLVDLVKGEERERAYLLEDALDHNTGLRELTSPWLDALDRILKKHNSFLIITTEWELKDLEDLHVCKILASTENLQRVFEKHLDRFARHIEGVDVLEQVVKEARDCWPLISTYLKRPAQIERFCYKLGELRSGCSDNQFEELAKESAYIGKMSVRRAFRELGDNQKLYALLTILFDGVQCGVLNEIYSLSVRHLRAEGVATLRDEREIGLEDILEQIRARESETRQVIIEDAEFREEILNQIRNHRLLLYSLSNKLLALCEQYSTPEHWDVRRAIGCALGRLATQEKRGLLPISRVLDELASHEHAGIAAVAGFILAQVCREASQFQGEVLTRLYEWVKSGHPDRMWAAGAATWRIYEALGAPLELADKSASSRSHRRVLGVIAALAHRAGRFSVEACEGASSEQMASWSSQNLRCAFFALVRILSTSLSSARNTIKEWLRGKRGDPIRDIVQFACREVLEQVVSGKRGLLQEEGAWLELIEPILTQDTDLAQVGDALLAAFAHWSCWGEKEDDKDAIYSHLLKTANRLSGRSARIFRAGLVQYWLTNSNDHVRRRGRALLQRSHAMEGLPWRYHGPVAGLVALDSSSEARTDPSGGQIFREILEVAGCFVEVTAAHLGGSTIPAPVKGMLEDNALRSPFARPRLLLPALESSTREMPEPRVVVVLSWGPILDLIDGEGFPWWPPLQVTVGSWHRESEEDNDGKSQDKSGQADVRPLVQLTQDLDDIAMGIVRLLNSHPAKPLQDTSPTETFWQDLPELDCVDPPIDASDCATRMISALLDQSTKDLAKSLRILHAYLDDPKELPRRIASAGVRALLRFYEQPGRRPTDGEKKELLRLAFRLCPADEGAAETVLETILAWMDETPWAETVEGGDGICLDWMRWFERLIQHQARNMNHWISSRHGRETTKKEANEAVLRALRRLRFRLSLGTSGTLPALEDGKKYGLFLLDSFSFDRMREAALAQLIADLLACQQLRDLPCLVFRLGCKAPLMVPGEKLAREDVLPAAGVRLPRLLGPILDELPAEQILFTLVLSSEMVLDAGDWCESSWAPRIRLYGPSGGTARSEPFVRISSVPDKDKEADFVLRNLKPLIEQGA